MARKPRVDAPGYWHHIWHRAAAERLAFRDGVDQESMWGLLSALRHRFGVEVHAVALMSTHLHLVVRSADGRLSEAMQWMLSIYTKRFNRRHALNGALFQGRFKSGLIHSDAQLATTIRYVHTNPLDIVGIDTPQAYPWSSCARHAGLRSAPTWVPTTTVAYLLRNDPRLARSSTKRRSSVRARRFPPVVPPEAIAHAVAGWPPPHGSVVPLEALLADPRVRGPSPRPTRRR